MIDLAIERNRGHTLESPIGQITLMDVPEIKTFRLIGGFDSSNPHEPCDVSFPCASIMIAVCQILGRAISGSSLSHEPTAPKRIGRK